MDDYKVNCCNSTLNIIYNSNIIIIYYYTIVSVITVIPMKLITTK